MKQVFIAGLVALCATAGFAQNSATISQNGTSLTANANQTGNLNTAVVSQTGSAAFNRAYATQTGTSQTATISQDASGGTIAAVGSRTAVLTGNEGNWSGTYQSGNSNRVTISQSGAGTKANFAETWQKGGNNKATTIQDGAATKNQGEIFQGINTRPNEGGEGTTNFEVTDNTATIYQSAGTGNKAKITQLRNDNTGTISQTAVGSTNNTAYILQGVDGAGTTAPGGNEATIAQTGISSGNSATAIQTGTNGNVLISQSTNATDNIAFVRQISGNGSYATVLQSDGSSTNNAKVIQYGDFHNANISQQGYSGAVSNNFAVINEGSSSTSSDHDQVFAVQETGVTSSTITINQNTVVGGKFNLVGVSQIGGTLNQALFNQEGSYNTAGLVQSGVGSHTATITQTGDYNVVKGAAASPDYPGLYSASQNGSGHSMSVIQTATGATAAIFNSASLDQAGTGNTLIVNQTITAGAPGGNTTTVSQGGTGNTATVTQINGSSI